VEHLIFLWNISKCPSIPGDPGEKRWDQYRSGFGQSSGEYWLGLENTHLLTQRKQYELRVDLGDFEGAKAHVQYSSFSVDSEHEGYKLHLSGFKDGGAGKSMDEHNGQKFSIFDKGQGTHASNSAKSYLSTFCSLYPPISPH
ncbi:microfibril-associated glycoprotein 4-like, partial [Oncorhynchus kisutch]|uniref:microfibril-associated glycoprotein 4-like n=1 Tax=Oncorhynchus kisutch TaxID=8019 RepID=UPI0012DDC59D